MHVVRTRVVLTHGHVNGLKKSSTDLVSEYLLIAIVGAFVQQYVSSTRVPSTGIPYFYAASLLFYLLPFSERQ